MTEKRHNHVKGVFNGHTARQHRASSRKGGLARMKKWTREDQRRIGLKSEAARLKRLAEGTE